MREKLLQAFRDRFGGEAEFIVRAPGRVNLIGEHTDYNDGFVMPLAIERATWLAVRSRSDDSVCLHSVDFEQTEELDLRDLEEKQAKHSWGGYLRGVAWAMGTRYPQLDGWEGVSLSNIPIGAGLSSSASFELAVAGAFSAVGGFEWDAKRMAVLCHKAEVEWVGVNCGLMDHLASAEGHAGKALLIDCRSLEATPIPLPAESLVVVLDTGKARSLADSAYNERRAQCEEAARLLGVNSLRDASPELLDATAGKLDPVTYRRARHVIFENDRTIRAARAMEENDSVLLGRLMVESHKSLRDDYEVSCRELDVIVESALAAPGCFGARMTGAGFGGCAIALVKHEDLDAFLAQVAASYSSATGLEPKLYASPATDGVNVSPVHPAATQQQ